MEDHTEGLMGTMTAAPARGDFEAALRSDEPLSAMRAAIVGLSQRGYSRDSILGFLREFRENLSASHRTDDEDIVLEAMDLLTGWAGPGAVISA
jgi:hypothetical protein